MPMYQIRITQTFRTERVCTVEVEADTVEEAVERIDDGDFDIPGYSDPTWDEDPILQDESVRPA